MADSRDADWEWANHLVRLAMQSSVDLTLAHQLVNNSSQASSFPSIPSSSNSSNTTTKMEKKKVLLLLDMNGTLLYRSKVSLKSTIKKGFSHNNLCYYFRPHALEFIGWLLRDYSSLLNIAFYTSMSTKNALAGVAYFNKQLNEDIYLYDQKMNKNDPLGEQSWSFMRDMPKIWTCKGSPGYGHDERSTIMIDDTEHKMREYPRNVLVVPEFNEEALLAHEESPDDVLIRLKVILKQIFQQIENVTQLNGFDFDVRDVLQEHRPAIDTLNRRS